MCNIVHLGCLFSMLPRLLVNFLSVIVGIFYHVQVLEHLIPHFKAQSWFGKQYSIYLNLSLSRFVTYVFAVGKLAWFASDD